LSLRLPLAHMRVLEAGSFARRARRAMAVQHGQWSSILDSPVELVTRAAVQPKTPSKRRSERSSGLAVPHFTQATHSAAISRTL
jgi:hypothetical protein